jgi:hypothetical protein
MNHNNKKFRPISHTENKETANETPFHDKNQKDELMTAIRFFI